MSTLSQFAAGGIKSIQRGTASPGAVTITAVDTAKSILIANSSSGYSLNNSFPDQSISIIARARLNSSTAVVVLNGTNVFLLNSAPIVDWQVIEYF